jgi:three-Cys-motif partner protein
MVPEPDAPQQSLPLDGATERDEQVLVSLPSAPVIASDGLPARVIRPHTLEKFGWHGALCTIFATGMKGMWAKRRGYLELFAATGLAVVDDDRSEVDGCPLQAIERDFARLAVVAFNPHLAAALEQRLRARGVGPDRARVFWGDANDPRVLAEALAFLPDPGLNLVFIDPEDINADWEAIKFIASRPRQRADFLVNLPIGAMKRNPTSKAITTVLGTDEWIARYGAGEPLGLVFRETMSKQFERIGFQVARHKEIRAYANQTPIYDLVFASRHARGVEFWRKIEKINPVTQQRTLF